MTAYGQDNLVKSQPKSSNRKDYIYLRGSTARKVRIEYYKALGFSPDQIAEAESVIADTGFTGWQAFCLDEVRSDLLPDDQARAWFRRELAATQELPKGSRSKDATKEEKALHRRRQKALARIRRTAEMMIEDWPQCAPSYDDIANDYIAAHKGDSDFKEFWPDARESRF